MQGNSLNNLKEKKQKILEIINNKGPSLPSTISREIGVSLLLTSALLSDMRAEKSVRLSRLRIGGSPLYYVQGQEQQLENFVKHLPQKEREAFELLKKKEIIDEEKVEPAYRVAFNNMKDFAFPVYVKQGETEKTFWRFHAISQEEVSKKISELFKKKEIKPKLMKKEKTEVKEERPEIKPKQKKRSKKEDFRNKVLFWINEKGIDLVEEADDEDTIGIVSAKSNLGKLNFLLIAKQKKRINEADLSLAYQKGQQIKTPVLFLTTGKLTKKAQNYMKNFGKFIIVNFI